MLLNLRSSTGETIQVRLQSTSPSTDATLEWRSAPDEPQLTIRQDEAGVTDVRKASEISSSAEEIREQFLAALSEVAITESGGIEYLEEGLPDDDVDFPYDPETIRVDTKPFNISLVYEMIKDGDINLSPDFQRQFVWTDIGARSRLIESIMLRIPLPVFYMSQDRSGRLHVVDGLQRLTVISQFLDNRLKLRDLEYLKEEEGKIFRDDDPAKCIDQRYRKRIMQTQIMFNIIDPQTPTDVKFDIFKRINQGGRPLNAQEIRNCMSAPATRALIGSLATSEEFLAATQASVGTVRMQNQELTLRFLAFRLTQLGLLEAYSGNMDRFLDDATDTLNNNESVHGILARDFRQAMRNGEHLFGQYAFRKCLSSDLEPGARRRLINNSLFTTWSVTLADIPDARTRQQAEGSFATLVAEELERDLAYLDSVTSGTNDRRRLSYAFSVARRFCEEHVR
ncbi:DUF262 domain-containing protein [Mesorhizobium delmotii]|uniref:DUF262 domain-containing protein n=1 Tax=Mesorhizobium delmotii TaxID=1631247 RepID=UPI000F43B502|nr:DUF262 domain-containing protein [Mesorhizobium delmotii]